MIMNLNVKIKAGPRTPVEVSVYGSARKVKNFRFANREEITEAEIVEWLQKSLQGCISSIQAKPAEYNPTLHRTQRTAPVI